ncbi:MAG: response regulator [Myxococcota bacterium]
MADPPIMSFIEQMSAPKKALCLLSNGARFEAPILRIGTTSVFLKTDREDLRFTDGLQVTLLDRHGPVLTFHGQVATWVRRSGARIECGPDTDDVVFEQLGEWSSDLPSHDAAIPRTGEVPVLEEAGRPSSLSPARLRASPRLRELMEDAQKATPSAPRTWGAVDVSLPPVQSGTQDPLPRVESSSSSSSPDDSAPKEVPGRASTNSKPRLDARVLGHPAASTALAGTRVLVIDDDPGIVRLLERCLKKFGCIVVGTDDPPTGLKMAADREADVVVMDWVLPAIPGARMLQQLREVLPDTPIAVISGALWWDEAERQIRDMGATTVLEKPIDFEKLVDFLRQVRSGTRA